MQRTAWTMADAAVVTNHLTWACCASARRAREPYQTPSARRCDCLIERRFRAIERAGILESQRARFAARVDRPADREGQWPVAMPYRMACGRLRDRVDGSGSADAPSRDVRGRSRGARPGSIDRGGNDGVGGRWRPIDAEPPRKASASPVGLPLGTGLSPTYTRRRLTVSSACSPCTTAIPMAWSITWSRVSDGTRGWTTATTTT